MATYREEFAAKYPWAAGKDWEKVCTGSITVYSWAVIILIAMPVQWIEYHTYTIVAYRMFVYLLAIGSIAYVFAQALPIMFRPPSKETAAIDDQQKSLRPKIMLIIVPILKVVVYILVFGIAPALFSEKWSWNPLTWDRYAWNPLEWFTLEQFVVWVIAWFTVRFDLVILQWIAYRFARLTDEISSDKIS